MFDLRPMDRESKSSLKHFHLLSHFPPAASLNFAGNKIIQKGPKISLFQAHLYPWLRFTAHPPDPPTIL